MLANFSWLYLLSLLFKTDKKTAKNSLICRFQKIDNFSQDRKAHHSPYAHSQLDLLIPKVTL
jgi:hypothetical protein